MHLEQVNVYANDNSMNKNKTTQTSGSDITVIANYYYVFIGLTFQYNRLTTDVLLLYFLQSRSNIAVFFYRQKN